MFKKRKFSESDRRSHLAEGLDEKDLTAAAGVVTRNGSTNKPIAPHALMARGDDGGDEDGGDEYGGTHLAADGDGVATVALTGSSSEKTARDLPNTAEFVMGAACQDEEDECDANDARAQLERNLEVGEQRFARNLDRERYHGQDAYTRRMKVSAEAPAKNKFTGLYGPLRASKTALRSTPVVDYNPEICKDYNETGYCGFGDTCKFLHDRYTDVAGWRVESEWKAEQQRIGLHLKKMLGGD